jgi:hypothetical protein
MQFNILMPGRAIGISEPPHRKIELAFPAAGIYLLATHRSTGAVLIGNNKEDAMDCSQTICFTWDALTPDPIVSTPLRYPGATVMAYLKALVTPEPSDGTALGSAMPSGRLFGAVKASLWVLAAIGSGIMLSFVCG